MRGVVVEEQIQWVLSYVQEESVDIWKENVLEDLEEGKLEYKICRKVFGSHQEEVQNREGGVNKSGRIKKIRARRKDNGRICSRIQKSSKKEQIQREAVNKGVQEENEWDNQEKVNGGRKSSHQHRAVVQVCH